MEHLCPSPSPSPISDASEQQQGFISPIEHDQGFQAYVFFLSMLGVLVSVKFQGNDVSLFDKHNAIISSFVVVISIYVGTIIIGKNFKFGTEGIGLIRLLSGTMAPILLLLILVQKFGKLLLVLWVFLAAKMAWDYLPQLYHHLRDYLPQLYHHLLDQASGLVSNLRGLVSNLLAKLKILGSRSKKESQELPV